MNDGLIQATSRGVKNTLVDGTVRFVIDVEPAQANAAFALLGMPGSPLVVARLTTEAAKEQAQQEAQKPKGGELAKLAGRWCAMPEFQEWCLGEHSTMRATELAAEWVRETCDIQSRAELDHDEIAAQLFHERIREPFREWCHENGVVL